MDNVLPEIVQIHCKDHWFRYITTNRVPCMVNGWSGSRTISEAKRWLKTCGYALDKDRGVYVRKEG